MRLDGLRGEEVQVAEGGPRAAQPLEAHLQRREMQMKVHAARLHDSLAASAEARRWTPAAGEALVRGGPPGAQARHPHRCRRSTTTTAPAPASCVRRLAALTGGAGRASRTCACCARPPRAC
eukprot:scaffold4163_cov425-Prasinococcus_capsulatus_cf.AAC.3